MKIQHKLLLFVLTVVIAAFGALSYLSYVSGRRALVAEIKKGGENMFDSYVNKLNAMFERVEDVPEELMIATQNLKPENEDEVKELIKSVLSIHPEVYGAAIAFEPNKFDPNRELVGVYYHWKDKDLHYVDLGTKSYNYPSWDWYKIPATTSKPNWTEPYMDLGGGDVNMITYSLPFFKDGRVWGVATVDVALSKLTDIVSDIRIGKSGSIFLVSKDGTLLSSHAKGKDLKETIFDVAKELKFDQLNELGKKMTALERGFMRVTDPVQEKKALFAFGPISSIGWSLAIEFPEDELLSGLIALHRNMILISLVGILTISAMIYLISKRISQPISNLVTTANRIAEGDFTTKLKGAKGRDEVSMLTRAFGEMQTSLEKTLGQVREEKEMFQVAFSQMSDGIVILDRDWHIIKYNQTAEKLLGLPTEQPLFKHVQTLFNSSHSFEQLDEMTDKLCTCKLSRKESNGLIPLHLACVISPIFDKNHELKERVLSIRDVTSMEAEELSKRNFLSLISHKLFTPLAVLKGKIMLLKDGLLGELNENQMKNVDSMISQSGKLSDLIEELVNFVSLEDSRLDASRESLNLNVLFDEIARETEKNFPEKHASVKVSVDSNVPEISFNKKYFNNIVKQLIDNGLKFNMNDPAIVEIKCTQEGNQIVISVNDNGIGIPPEFLDKIFDKFYQIDRYFTGNVEGVGLGLTYAKKIIEHFGGKLGVTSQPGKGSSFQVSFKIS